ncbi:MAG: glycoside hydrolase family 3 C-terminal domain-containing protein, partial [Bacteroidales bacterium]|nr:glycoside hydrolase family 3 C-terminal domain-containing protein [Bacteroidales bacterium]
WTNGLSFTKTFAYDDYFLAKPFLEKLKTGEIDESVVNEKVRRILRLMYRTNMNPNRLTGRMNNKEHHEVARKIGVEGIVLLENKNGFFPIDPDKEITIAVIGENATRSMTVGGGSSELKAQYEISPLVGLQKRFTNAKIVHSIGYAAGASAWGKEIPSRLDADSLIKAAVDVAAKADVVLFIGGLNKNHFQDCEGGDRKQLGLPFGQDKLINELAKVNSNIGVILISGNAVKMQWLPSVKTVMQAWYLGSDAGFAIADVVSGDENPSGKLPFTFPVKLNDNAAHSFGEMSYPGDSINQYYKEDIYVGYRWHDTKKIKPLFAFGHGLSYTDFKISDAKADKKEYAAGETIKISCQLSNIGDRAGSEVVQVYVGMPNSKVERAQKELKAFKKVLLEKGISKNVELTINVDNLAFYDESVSDWNLEKGEYIIYVGNASDNIIQKIKISVK